MKLKTLVKQDQKLNQKIISYKLQFIDSVRFMTSSLPYLVDNLVEGTHKTKGKYRHDSKNVKNVELNTKITSSTLNM